MKAIAKRPMWQLVLLAVVLCAIAFTAVLMVTTALVVRTGRNVVVSGRRR